MLSACKVGAASALVSSARKAVCSSVMDACLPALNENGIALIQPTEDDEGGRWVRTILIHGASGTELSCRVPLIVGKNDMQGYGSAVTYARRYGLMAMAGIAPEDDDGNAAAKAAPKAEEPRKPAGPTAVQIAAESLSNADTLDQLAAIWKDIPRSVQGDAAVIKAKDDRKAVLQNADLGGDEIKY